MGNPSDKFQILKGSTPLPSSCIACGMQDKGNNEFVDLTKDIDYFGAVLLCVTCAKEIAYVVGFVSEEDADDVRLENARIDASLEEALEKVRVLEDVVFTYGIECLAISDTINDDSSNHADEESVNQPATVGESTTKGHKPRPFE